ncbi:MAG: tryptophan 2,3-dioxygenase [Bdellovibrionaceae bacterium]|nr:tryptophan 2,3-dioxygenase [Pseudobdellovibrionaceae bacterium]
MKYPPTNYHDYLQLDTLLSAQKPKSSEYGFNAHDELLFITVHQTYELWFKQILHELESVLEVFKQDQIAERDLGVVLHRLERIVAILKLSIGNIDILETMTPLDFLDFRDALFPASGFQSYQFRLIEILMGLGEKQRLQFNNTPFWKHLTQKQQQDIQSYLKEQSLLDRVDAWLSRTPFVFSCHFDFRARFSEAVREMLKNDENVVMNNPRLNADEKKKNSEQIRLSLDMFESLMNEQKFEELRRSGHFRMSHKAILGALFISLYRDEPLLQTPYRVIHTLSDLDETLTAWRQRHALMAHRMLGRKIGTGGTSGHDYLRAAAEQHRVFTDFFNLTTFLLPRSQRPPLPEELTRDLDFRLSSASIKGS